MSLCRPGSGVGALQHAASLLAAELGVVDAAAGSEGASLDLVDGREGHDGQDDAAVQLLHQGGHGQVPGDGGDDEAPDAGKLHQVVIGLSAGQEEEEQGQGEEEGGQGQVGTEGAQPQEEGVDAPERQLWGGG